MDALQRDLCFRLNWNTADKRGIMCHLRQAFAIGRMPAGMIKELKELKNDENEEGVIGMTMISGVINLRCPGCGMDFSVDESKIESVIAQVKDHVSDKIRMEAKIEQEKAVRDAVEKALAEKRVYFVQLKEKAAADLAAAEQTVSELRHQLDCAGHERTIAIQNAIAEIEKDKVNLAAELQHSKEVAGAEMKLAVKQAQEKLLADLQEREAKIHMLQSQLETQSQAAKLQEQTQKDHYEAMLRYKDEIIQQIKEYKAKQSTKALGESLERFCQDEFNKIRSTAFPDAYFEKDNDATSGTKGDFIYRESVDGQLILSIMFDMKTEADETATKHKNEDFFAKLDKDRREKKCEYAILVSTLEAESEYYNAGIQDVSYRYPKMYVVRPQQFIAIISLLRNAALNSVEYQKELALVKSQQLDLTTFEANMNEFKDSFGRNYRLASDKLKAAVEGIDKIIASLQKTKDNLLASENQLRLANNKAEDLSVRKLTKGAPSVAAKLAAIKTAMPGSAVSSEHPPERPADVEGNDAESKTVNSDEHKSA